MKDSVAIITVNYKTSNLVIESIRSVQNERNDVPNIDMYIVDNDSQDESFEKISKFVTENQLNWVHVIDAGRNGGYAAGNNVALRKIQQLENKPEYLWFLNPDTCLRKNATQELIKFIVEKGVGIAGSRLEDEDGTAQVSSFNFPGAMSELSAGFRLGVIDRFFKSKLVTREIMDEPEECDWLAGASLMIKYEVFEKIGLMDEQYFLYFEELDYCLAAYNAGYRCWYVPSSRVHHSVGASTGISDYRKSAPRRPKYWFDSRRRFFLKNFGPLKLVVADLLYIIGYASWCLRTLLIAKEKFATEPPHFLLDFVKNSFIFRGFKLES